MAAKIKKGDRVIVLTGKDKGRSGQVLQVMPKDNRVLVAGINMVKRHTRPTQQLPQGGILEKEASVHISNLQVICGKCGKPTRIGHKVLANGQKMRACKKCGEILDKEK